MVTSQEGVLNMVSLAGVEPAYRHVAKLAAFRGLTTAAGMRLKWYDLAPAAASVSSAVHDSAREFMDQTLTHGRVAAAGDCGFVILHRCGAEFHFLILSVWRGNNEIWEAVFYRDRGMSGFEPFLPAYSSPGALRPTFCVWELGIVAFEAAAWARFCADERTADALRQWEHSAINGAV
jgi:hypothetical protein